MSLVAYDASSSDEDDDVVPIKNPQTTSLNAQPPPTQPQNISTKPSQKPESSSTSSSIVKLPDASELLSSAGFGPSSLSGATDHSSLVAAAMAARNKRGSPDSSSSLLRSSKLPRGALPRSKNVPDTASRTLVPPQLSGRSNIVTEDINKLFVKKKVAVEVVPQDNDD